MNSYANFSKVLKEILVTEVSLKQLKIQHPEYVAYVDRAAKEIDNKYLLFFVKKLVSFKEKNYSDFELSEIINDVIDATKRFEAISKNGKLDAFIKSGKADQHQKDINSWADKPLYLLIDFITRAEDIVTDTEKRKLAKSSSEKIYEDERFTILTPHSYEASCYFGAGTKWCISGRSSVHYRNYVERGYEFIFVIDKNPNDPRYAKVAIAFIPKELGNWDAIEIFDTLDDSISLDDYEKNEKVWKVVVNYIRKRWQEVKEELWSKIPFRIGDRVRYKQEVIRHYGLDRVSKDQISGVLEDVDFDFSSKPQVDWNDPYSGFERPYRDFKATVRFDNGDLMYFDADTVNNFEKDTET